MSEKIKKEVVKILSFNNFFSIKTMFFIFPAFV